MWARSLHRPSHHVSRPRRRLWHRLRLLLLCLLHLLQLFPGQHEKKTKSTWACRWISDVLFIPFLSRCSICSWLWSWITLSTWLGTLPSWVHITWMSLFAYGENMIVLRGEVMYLFFWCIFVLATFYLWSAGGSKVFKMLLHLIHSMDMSSLAAKCPNLNTSLWHGPFYCREKIRKHI